jgi:RNA polymerase sigma factor (sigma-70 family)
MRGLLAGVSEPDDVVSEVWRRALPKLTEALMPPEGRCTPRVIQFLSTMVLLRVNELLRWAHRHRCQSLRAGAPISNSGPVREPEIVDPGQGVWKSVLLREAVRTVLAAMDRLEPRDQEILILRAVEGESSSEVAKRLAITKDAVHVRLMRARRRLEAELPGSIFEELWSGDEGVDGGTPTET